MSAFNTRPERVDVPPGAVLPNSCESGMDLSSGGQRARLVGAQRSGGAGDKVARLADYDQIARFVDALFRYASEGNYIALHSFYHDSRRPPPDARKHRLQSSEVLIRLAAQRATYVANLSEPTVFAPPICTFATSSSAAETNLAEGLAVSLECDARPVSARQLLEGLLGRATVVVASGGEWVDPATGEVHSKLHLHWRLAEPTRELSDHQRLKRARQLAALLADSDTTAVTTVHPLRWPGSWHLKAEPRQARIVACDPAQEVHLEDALDALEGAANMRGIPLDDEPLQSNGNATLADDEDLTALARAIPNDATTDWNRWNTVGMAFYAASAGSDAGFSAFDEWSAKNEIHDADTTSARWQHWGKSPPTKVSIGKLVYLARSAQPSFRLPSWNRSRCDTTTGAKTAAIPQRLGDARFDLSHDGLALDMGCRWQKNARHVAPWSGWLFWADSRWQRDQQLVHMTRTRDYLRDRANTMVQAAAKGEIEDLDIEKAEVLAKQLRSAPMVAHVIGLARSNAELVASAEQWDADPWALGTPAGTVDLRTGELRTAHPADYITKQTAVAPAPHGAPAPLWTAFLERITAGDTELQGYLQRFAGYSLTGSIREHAFAFGYGTGANGKSVFIETLAGILNDYALTVPIEMLMVSQSDRHPTEVARLQGIRLAIGSETEDGRQWAETKIKSLTGGDRIAARYMRQDFFEFNPSFKLFVVGNHKPSLRAVDEAIRRRLHFVPFNVTIPPGERDPDLRDKLKAEWAAILRWAIDGCLAWQCEGLAPPASVRDATADYLAAEDAFERWLDDCCTIDRNAWESSAGLWQSWKAWAERAGEFVGKQRKFSDKLEEHGFTAERDGTRANNRGYRGARLNRPDYTEDPRYGS